MSTATVSWDNNVFSWVKQFMPKSELEMKSGAIRGGINTLGVVAMYVSFFLVHQLSWDGSGVLWGPNTWFYAKLYQLGMDASARSADAMMVARGHLAIAFVLWGIGHLYKFETEAKKAHAMGFRELSVACMHNLALFSALWGMHLSSVGLLTNGKLTPGGMDFTFSASVITTGTLAGHHIGIAAALFIGGLFHLYTPAFQKGSEHLNNDWEALLGIMLQTGACFLMIPLIMRMAVMQDPVTGFGYLNAYATSAVAHPTIQKLAASNPGFLVKQMILGQSVLAVLSIIAGTFHASNFIYRSLGDAAWVEKFKDLDPFKRLWALNTDEKAQYTFMGQIFFAAFVAMHLAYGVAIHNTMADLAKGGVSFASNLTYIDWAPTIHNALFGSKGTINDFVACHAIAGGLHFTMVPLARMSMFSKFSPWTRLHGIKAKRDGEFACLGPAYGGTCSISLVDQAMLACLFSLQIISPLFFYVDGAWMGSMVSTGSDTYKAIFAAYQADPSTYTMYGISQMTNAGYFNYFLNKTAMMYTAYDGDLVIALLGAHFLWAFSLSMIGQYRGSRDEGAMVLKWGHQGIPFVQKYVFPRAFALQEGRIVGTSIFFSMTIACLWCLAMI